MAEASEFGRDALRRDEIDAVSGLEISEGVVGGDDAAAVGRDISDLALHFGLERIELAGIGRGIRLIGRLPGRIGRDQRVTDIGDIDFRVRDRLPGMRIGIGIMTMAMPLLFRLARLDVLARDDHRGLGAGRFDKARNPAFEAEPIGEHDFGVGEFLRIVRRRRVNMGVAIDRNEACDLDAVAADILHEVGEDREGRDDLHFLLRAWRARTAASARALRWRFA